MDGLTSQNVRYTSVCILPTDGFTQKNLTLMLAKIEFMARLKPHVNIVKFIGAIQNDNIEGSMTSKA